jgi:hypothetical protein
MIKHISIMLQGAICLSMISCNLQPTERATTRDSSEIADELHGVARNPESQTSPSKQDYVVTKEQFSFPYIMMDWMPMERLSERLVQEMVSSDYLFMICPLCGTEVSSGWESEILMVRLRWCRWYREMIYRATGGCLHKWEYIAKGRNLANYDYMRGFCESFCDTISMNDRFKGALLCLESRDKQTWESLISLFIERERDFEYVRATVNGKVDVRITALEELCLILEQGQFGQEYEQWVQKHLQKTLPHNKG